VLHRWRSRRRRSDNRRRHRSDRRRRGPRFVFYFRLCFNPMFDRRRRDRRLHRFSRLNFFDYRRRRHFNMYFGSGFDVLFLDFRFIPRNYLIAGIHSKFAAQLVSKTVFDRVRMGRHRNAHVLQFADDFRVVAI
jgi:hypothetical protein